MSRFSRLVENWPWLLLSTMTLAMAIFITKLIRHRRLYATLPTPPHSLLWGNLKVMGETMTQFPAGSYFSPAFSHIAKKFGMEGIYYLDLWPFSEPMVFLLDPELALQAQTSQNFTRHRISSEFLGGLVGTTSLFATYGKEWQQQRQWFSPAFSLNHLLTLVPGMIEEVLVFKEILASFATSKKQFSMNEELTKLTMDVIGRSVGDIKLNSQSKHSGIQAAFQGAINSCAGLGTGAPPWRRVLKAFKLRWYTRKLDKLLIPIIKKKFATNMMTGADAKTILGLTQKGYLKHKADEKSSKNIGEDEEFLKMALDNAKTFFTAGFDTTSSTISYFYYLLAIHPDILSRVRAEHDDVLGKSVEETITTLTNTPQALSKLPLTSAVLKEVLRLFPIGFTVREALPGTTVNYKGREYPVDNHTIVVFGPHMQRDEGFWTNPEVFNPERWLDQDNVDLGRDNGSWQPFERGPRNCIGQQLALIEARVIAALTLRYFDFEPKLNNDGLSIPGWGDQVYQVFQMTAKPRDGLPMVVKLRTM